MIGVALSFQNLELNLNNSKTSSIAQDALSRGTRRSQVPRTFSSVSKIPTSSSSSRYRFSLFEITGATREFRAAQETPSTRWPRVPQKLPSKDTYRVLDPNNTRSSSTRLKLDYPSTNDFPITSPHHSPCRSPAQKIQPPLWNSPAAASLSAAPRVSPGGRLTCAAGGAKRPRAAAASREVNRESYIARGARVVHRERAQELPVSPPGHGRRWPRGARRDTIVSQSRAAARADCIT